jgi:hypothetical protein
MVSVSEKLLGFRTEEESIDRTQTVTTTGDRIVKNNPDRIQLVFINPSSTDVTVDTRPQVTTGEGFVVPSKNGTLTFDGTTDGSLPTREFHGIVPTGTVDLITIGEEVIGQLTVDGDS